MDNDLQIKIKQFVIDEAKACSMDYGCMTPLYVYRMWGGTVPFDEIEEALQVVKSRIWS